MIVHNKKTKGVFLILSSVCMYSLMSCSIRYIATVSSYKTAFARFFVGLVVIGGLSLTGAIKLKFTNRKLLFLRGLLGGIAVYTAYLAVAKLGVGKGTMILYTYPIFAFLFSSLLLKEKVHWANIIALAVVMTGLFLLVANKNGGSAFFLVGKYELIGIFGVALAGITVVIIRKLHETETSFEIFFAQCVVGVLLMVLPANTSWSQIKLSEIIVLLAIGLFAVIGQLFMTEGFRYLPVKTASVLSMIEPVLNYIAGLIIFHELLTARSTAGAVLVLIGCMVVILYKEKS